MKLQNSDKNQLEYKNFSGKITVGMDLNLRNKKKIRSPNMSAAAGQTFLFEATGKHFLYLFEYDFEVK